MSIREFVHFWLRDRDRGLTWHEPAIAGMPTKRYLLLAPEVRRAVSGPWKSAKEENRFGGLRGDLDAFVEGRRISVAMDPYNKAKTAYIARIDPVAAELWDIRSIDPRPSVRILGGFAGPDEFVALVWDYRENLDGPGGPRWASFVGRARHEWGRLFKGLPPHAGSNASDYISSDIFLV